MKKNRSNIHGLAWNLGIILLILGPPQARAQMAHPNMFLDQSEIDGIRAKIQAGEDPWRRKYNDVISKADSLLDDPCPSVTDNGGGNVWDDNDISQTAPKAADMIQYLGLAYVLSGDRRYADKAVQCIDTWCVDPATRLDPTQFHEVQFIRIPQYHTAIMFGIDLVWNSPGFTAEVRDGVRQWAGELGVSFRFNQDKWEHNRANWETMVVMQSAALAEDGEMLNWALNFLEEDRLVRYIDPDGGTSSLDPVHEKPILHYMQFGAIPMMNMIDMARHLGYDYYNYTPYNHDKNWAWAQELIAEYQKDPNTYPHNKGWRTDAYVEPHTSMGLLYTGKQVFRDVLETYSYPENNWNLRPSELTHAPGAYDPWRARDARHAFPHIKPASRSFIGTQEIIIDNPVSGGVVRYTLDGSEPTTASQAYSGPFTISATRTIKAKIFKDGQVSATAISNLTRETPWPALSVQNDSQGWRYEVYDNIGNNGSGFDVYAEANSPDHIGVTSRFEGGSLNSHHDPAHVPPLGSAFYGVKFEGYLDLDRDDVWTFITYTKDVAHLYIDEQLVSANDRAYRSQQPVDGIRRETVPLQAGKHLIELYFTTRAYENAAGGFDFHPHRRDHWWAFTPPQGAKTMEGDLISHGGTYALPTDSDSDGR